MTFYQDRIKSLQDSVREEMDAEVERRVKDLAINVFIDGEKVDIIQQTMIGEEIHIDIGKPVFFSETGNVGFITV